MGGFGDDLPAVAGPFNPAGPDPHARGAFTAQVDACLAVSGIVGDNTYLESILDEGDADYGIPSKRYYSLKQRLTRPDTLIRLNAGRAYLLLLKKEAAKHEAWVQRIHGHLDSIDLGLGMNPDLFIDNPLDLLEQSAFKAWFPIQKGAAHNLSFIRGSQRDYFITPEILEPVRDRLQPGDVLVERRSWHVTNAGIPGFCPHAALFTGTLEEMDAHFSGYFGPACPDTSSSKASAGRTPSRDCLTTSTSTSLRIMPWFAPNWSTRPLRRKTGWPWRRCRATAAVGPPAPVGRFPPPVCAPAARVPTQPRIPPALALAPSRPGPAHTL